MTAVTWYVRKTYSTSHAFLLFGWFSDPICISCTSGDYAVTLLRRYLVWWIRMLPLWYMGFHIVIVFVTCIERIKFTYDRKTRDCKGYELYHVGSWCLQLATCSMLALVTCKSIYYRSQKVRSIWESENLNARNNINILHQVIFRKTNKSRIFNWATAKIFHTICNGQWSLPFLHIMM